MVREEVILMTDQDQLYGGDKAADVIKIGAVEYDVLSVEQCGCIQIKRRETGGRWTLTPLSDEEAVAVKAELGLV
jgi:hypothetical protein